ncbi:hypothetical protein [Ekhidna sp.]|uniref:type IX secretion system anionic LPS delivery protein PorZ n=1 Tax=Ekhidna sp. TaxID=2608089 RepID=UPI003298AFBD
MKRSVDHASLRRLTLSSLSLLIGCVIYAQDIAIGTWRTHFSYKNAKELVVTSDKIFCASTNGLFSRSLASGETRKLSKIDGLSDVGISTMAYNESENVLVLGYRSGFADFIYENEIRSVSDLAKSNLDIEKTINDVAFNAQSTFLATDFGILTLNTSTAKVTENFVQIGTGGNEVQVFQIYSKNDSLFIRTNEGIQSGSLSQNLLDFNNWSRYPGSAGYKNLMLLNEKLYVTSGSDLLTRAGASWNDTGIDLPAGAVNLFDVANELFTADDNGNIFQLSGNTFQQILSTNLTAINDIEAVSSGYVFADDSTGLVDQAGFNLSPDGPISDVFSNFRVIRSELYGFHAPSPFSYNGSIQRESFSVFASGFWEDRTISGFANVSDVATVNNGLFFSSIGDGLYNEEADEILIDIPGSSAELDTVITALAADDRLWISSFRNNDPIHLLQTDGSWISYPSIFDDDYLTIDLSETGIGWLGSGSGAITVINPDENETELISTSDGLPASFIDIDISVEDNAWVATSNGPALFPDASFIFFSSEALLPTFDNRVLFQGEQINAVMTDGGNRIWFGTNSGVWVYNENTSEQVAVFNEGNSPLPSNRIIQLAYNATNGEVFIYTDRGMVSYRSASSLGGGIHRNVNIFPNPVRPEYQGLVGLTGLAKDVEVKVTDLNGNLVTKLNSNGGTASWNLRDNRGGQVTTGIYLFFSSTENGEETYVGKIAVIR